jgi:hypothetical protein
MRRAVDQQSGKVFQADNVPLEVDGTWCFRFAGGK